MIGFLTIAGIALLVLRKKRGVAGIGAVRKKRRIWREIADMQSDINFAFKFGELDPEQKEIVERKCRSFNKDFHRRSPITAEKYYNQLKRAYNSISGVGATSLPYRESVIKNDNDDVIMIYRDYGSDKEKLFDAINYALENAENRSEFEMGYYGALARIADGTRIVWGNSKGNIHKGLQAHLFGSNNPTERKKRISLIASKNKGGLYPEELAHELWESFGGYERGLDDSDIRNGALEALRSIQSKGDAQNLILDYYIKDHEIEIPGWWKREDTPF